MKYEYIKRQQSINPDNNLKDEGGEKMSDALMVNNTLTKLNLEG